MVSRLYATTRPLFRQLVLFLMALPLRLPPGRLERVALYLAGLILLDRDQTACRIARYLPGRAHDALNYLLRRARLHAHTMMHSLVLQVKGLGPGFLCLDDVVVGKPWSYLLPWVGWAYSTTRKEKVRGLVMVVLFWSNGRLRIPVAFRLWKPKERSAPGEYRTKLDLAQEMVGEVLAFGLGPTYIVFDAWYNARRFTRMLARHRLIWVSVLKANALVRPRRYYCPVGPLVNRPQSGVCKMGFSPRWGNGEVKLVGSETAPPMHRLVTKALGWPPLEVLRRHKFALRGRGGLPGGQATGGAGSPSGQGAPGSRASCGAGPPQLRGASGPQERPVRDGGPGQGAVPAPRHRNDARASIGNMKNA